MNNIGFSGIGSGIPIDDIVKATVNAEAVPLVRLDKQKKLANEQISAFSAMASRLDALASAMNKLKGPENFELLKSTSSNDKLFTATANHRNGATAGQYDIKVISEAKAYRWTSEEVDKTTQLTGEFTVGDKTFNIEDVLEEDKRSLDDLRAYINKEFGKEVSASLVNVGGDQARLVLTSKKTGEEGRLGVSSTALATDAALTSKPEFDPADPDNTERLDAHIKINDIDAYSSTNTFKEVVSGVTITLAQGASLQSNKSANLTVARDDAEIKNRIDNFIKAYNDVVIHLNEAKKGPLAGEGVIRAVESVLRDTLYTPTGGDGNLENTLNSLGIGTFVERGWEAGSEASSRNGTLEITDQERFNNVLENDFERLAFIFGDEETGYAARFEQAAKRLTSDTVENGQIAQGLIPMRRKGLNAEIKRLDERIESTNARLDLLEARLYKQFNAVDAMIANFNSTGNYLTQQFANLPGYTRPKK